jgi:hypothetical protein
MNIFWQGYTGISILLIFISLFIGINYFIKLKSESFWIRLMLPILRIASFSLLIILIADPFIKWSKRKIIPPKINLILDDSLSMSSSEQNLILLKRYLQSFTNMLDSIEIPYNINTLENIRIKSINNYKPINSNTQLTLLKDIVNENDISILVTDGNINSGKDLNSIVNDITSPIHVLGFGSKKSENDILIKNIIYPKFHVDSEDFVIEYTIFSDLNKSTEVTVILKNEKGILFKEKIKLTKGIKNNKNKIIIKENKINEINELLLISDIDEINKLNNLQKIIVEKLKSKRKVLLISGGISNNTRYIRELLTTQNRININHAKRIAKRWQNKWDESILLSADLIIFDGFPISNKDLSDFNNIIDKINVPFIYFSGPYENNYTISTFNKIKGLKSESFSGDNQFYFESNKKFPEINNYPTQSLNINWFSNNDIINFSNNSSAISIINGNTFIFIPELMKLNLKIKSTDNKNLINDYLEKIIKNEINNDFNPIQISIDNNELYLSEETKISLNIAGSNQNDKREAGILINNGEKNIYKSFNNYELKNGYNYKGEKTENCKLKGYIITIDNDTLWSKSLDLSILKLHIEHKDNYLNKIGLNIFAKKTGGTYLNLNNYSQLLEILTFKDKNKIIHKTISLLDFQKFWILIGMFLLVEWAIRKKNGLL